MFVIAGIIESQGKVLLQYRSNTGQHAEHWGLPGGKIESGETPQQAVRRELQEELGITFLTEHAPHYTCTAQGKAFAAYVIDEYTGKIENNEPTLCAELSWHALSALPSPLTPASALLLQHYANDH